MMSRSRVQLGIKAAFVACCTLGAGTVFAPCSLTDLRDSVIKGGLGAVEGAAKDALDSILVNFNEFFSPIPPADA